MTWFAGIIINLKQLEKLNIFDLKASFFFDFTLQSDMGMFTVFNKTSGKLPVAFEWLYVALDQQNLVVFLNNSANGNSHVWIVCPVAGGAV